MRTTKSKTQSKSKNYNKLPTQNIAFGRVSWHGIWNDKYIDVFQIKLNSIKSCNQQTSIKNAAHYKTLQYLSFSTYDEKVFMCRLEPINQSLLGIILFSMIPIAPCLISNVLSQSNSHVYVIQCA